MGSKNNTTQVAMLCVRVLCVRVCVVCMCMSCAYVCMRVHVSVCA